MLCVPGEPVSLLREPKNKHDRYAVAVVSARGIQIGYLPADRAPWIGAMVDEGREIAGIFQQATVNGCAIRLAFDGNAPCLPPELTVEERRNPDDVMFWPDTIPDD